MELHQLRYLVALARSGNFSRAAEACHVTQPSLSQQIQKLERELGERLFDRLRLRARLTPAGEVLLRRAERILTEVESAEREARDGKGLVRGVVRIGVLPTIAPYLLPRVIRSFSAAYPGVEVVVEEETTSRLLKLAAGGDLDLAIASLPLRDDRFEAEELFSEELLLVLPHGHPLSSKRTIRLKDIENERFILMKEGHCLGEQALDFCRRRDFHPVVSCRSAQIETIQSLVEAGLGISLVPRMAVRRSSARQPLYRSLEEPSPRRTIAALWPRRRRPGRTAQELLLHLRKAAEKMR